MLTNWAKISPLKLLFWYVAWLGGWLDSNGNITKQAGAELGQAQPELGFEENDLSLRGYVWGWARMARGLK